MFILNLFLFSNIFTLSISLLIMVQKFPANIYKQISNYIYAIYDPREALPFYVGRGSKRCLRASGSPIHYSYNSNGELYRFNENGKVINP